jgi:hypothetical protein
MKKLTLLFIITFLVFGCITKNSKDDDISAEAEIDNLDFDNDRIEAKMIGSFVGEFGRNKITVIINNVNKNRVLGRSIVGGNDRPFSGSYKIRNGELIAKADEPGDHVDDGYFSFNFSLEEKNILSGTWTPNDFDRDSKDFELKRKSFKYRKNVGLYPETAQRLLVEEDVENLSRHELSIMRNEIFARHGYCFSKKELRDIFEKHDWYVPYSTSVRSKMSEIEKKNVKLIKRYENYAEDMGDEFGR